MRKIFKLDWVIFVSIALLSVISLVALYSISANEKLEGISGFGNFGRQFLALGLGIFLMIFLSLFDYRSLNSFSTKLYFLILAVLAAVAFWGTTVRGTTGWISLGLFNIQPVEVAKVVMIIFLASFLSKKRNQLSILVRVLASIVLVIIPVLIILKQPDFGSAMIIVGVWIVMLLASGINKKNMFLLFLLGSIILTSGWFMLKDYQVERIQNFINPYNDPKGSGYNVIQSIVAVGSGGLWGKGLGHGSQSQLNFLPEKHTDFIFAVIAEELGLVGAVTVLILLGAVLYRIKETTRLARDNFGYLLGLGISTMLFLQIFVNIGMNMGIAPVVGVPLPFLSYGGSSLISVFASIGLVQSIYLRRMKSLD